MLEWNETTKEVLRSSLVAEINKAGVKACEDFEQVNCAYHKAVGKIRTCLSRYPYPDYKEEAKKDEVDLIPELDTISKPPSSASTLDEGDIGFVGEFDLVSQLVGLLNDSALSNLDKIGKINVRVSVEIEDITDVSDFDQVQSAFSQSTTLKISSANRIFVWITRF